MNNPCGNPAPNDVDTAEENRSNIQHPRGPPGIGTPKEILFCQLLLIFGEPGAPAHIEIAPSRKPDLSNHTLIRTGLPAFANARARSRAALTSEDFFTRMPSAPNPAATS